MKFEMMAGNNGAIKHNVVLLGATNTDGVNVVKRPAVDGFDLVGMKQRKSNHGR